MDTGNVFPTARKIAATEHVTTMRRSAKPALTAFTFQSLAAIPTCTAAEMRTVAPMAIPVVAADAARQKTTALIVMVIMVLDDAARRAQTIAMESTCIPAVIHPAVTVSTTNIAAQEMKEETAYHVFGKPTLMRY
jgi:hypothetical protein